MCRKVESENLPDRDRLCALPFVFSPGAGDASSQKDECEETQGLLALLPKGAGAEAFLDDDML